MYACSLIEKVNLTALRARYTAEVDRRPEDLRRYIQRCGEEGIISGDFVELRVCYYRKLGLPGRMYAQGPALQWLAREARSDALSELTYALDLCNCFPTLLLNTVRATHSKEKVPLHSLERYIRN